MKYTIDVAAMGPHIVMREAGRPREEWLTGRLLKVEDGKALVHLDTGLNDGSVCYMPLDEVELRPNPWPIDSDVIVHGG